MQLKLSARESSGTVETRAGAVVGLPRESADDSRASGTPLGLSGLAGLLFQTAGCTGDQTRAQQNKERVKNLSAAFGVSEYHVRAAILYCHNDNNAVVDLLSLQDKGKYKLDKFRQEWAGLSDPDQIGRAHV